MIATHKPENMTCQFNIGVIAAILFDKVDSLQVKFPHRIGLTGGQMVFYPDESSPLS